MSTLDLSDRSFSDISEYFKTLRYIPDLFDLKIYVDENTYSTLLKYLKYTPELKYLHIIMCHKIFDKGNLKKLFILTPGLEKLTIENLDDRVVDEEEEEEETFLSIYNDGKELFDNLHLLKKLNELHLHCNEKDLSVSFNIRKLLDSLRERKALGYTPVHALTLDSIIMTGNSRRKVEKILPVYDLREFTLKNHDGFDMSFFKHFPDLEILNYEGEFDRFMGVNIRRLTSEAVGEIARNHKQMRHRERKRMSRAREPQNEREYRIKLEMEELETRKRKEITEEDYEKWVNKMDKKDLDDDRTSEDLIKNLENDAVTEEILIEQRFLEIKDNVTIMYKLKKLNFIGSQYQGFFHHVLYFSPNLEELSLTCYWVDFHIIHRYNPKLTYLRVSCDVFFLLKILLIDLSLSLLLL